MTETLKSRTVHMVDCHDFDKLVSDLFNRPYNVGRAEDNPANNTVVTPDPEYLLNDLDEMAYAVEKFDTWMALPGNGEITGQDAWRDQMRASDASPPAALMILKLREKGVVMPEKFSIDIWW